MTRLMTLICTGTILGTATLAQDADAPAEPPENPIETSPVPEGRPDPEARQDEEPEMGAIDAEGGEGPTMEEPPTENGIAASLAEAPEELERCLDALEETGAEFERAETVADDDPDCGIVNPVRLNSLPGGIELSPAPLLRCDAALATAQWTVNHLIPAAETLGRGEMTRIPTGTGYQCRRRNNSATGPLSEHAFGNAIDVMGFEFSDGEAIPVEPREDEGTLAEAFQRTARAASCLHFTTVLGPGTDEAHADHLHLDVKERRGGYRLCQ